MQKIDFYLGAPLQIVPPPDNWMDFTDELSFESESAKSTLNQTKLTWKGVNAAFMNKWFQSGMLGGVGITEGVPLMTKICGTNEVSFNGVCDLTGDDTKWNCDIVEVTIRDRRMDMITNLFDSVSYSFLATSTANGGAGIINPLPISQGGDYVVIPYQINSVPDYVEFFTMGLSIYNIADKIYDVIDTLTSLVTGTTIDFATLVGAGAAILGIIEIIGYMLYLAAMILIIIDMLFAAFHYLVSPVFTKLGMYAHTLVEKACQYFGLQFNSTILLTAPFNKMVVMPAKPQWASNQTFTRELYNQFMSWTGVQARMQYDDLYNLQHGGFAYGYWDGTPGDFLRALEDVFNAKMKIIFDVNNNPVLHFERWDYQYNLAQLTLPNISEDAPFKQPFKTNASELAANYMVRHAMDDNDLNTYHYYDGSTCYAQTSQIVYSDPTRRNVVLQNLVEKNLVFSLAFRKDKLTACEEVLHVIWNIAAGIVNPIISLANGVVNIVNWVINLFCPNCSGIPTINHLPANPQWASTGHMLMSNNITSNPKIFLAGAATSNNWYGYVGVEVSADTRATNQPSLAASMLMKYFHFASLPLSVAPGAPYTLQAAGTPYFNQWYVYDGQKIPLCCHDFKLIENNNYVTLYDGRQARCRSVKWTQYKGTAMIDYSVRQQYTKNLKVLYTIDGATTTQTL